MPEDAHETRDDRDAAEPRDAQTAAETRDAPETEELPASVVDHAERLTRLAREAVDDDEVAAYRADREETLAEHDFTARVREAESGETLVLHPEEWLDDGTIRPDRIEDTGRAVEVSLSGAGDPDEWEAVDDRNRALVETVREERGDVHAANASVLADFAGNHYAKPIEDLTASELREFAGEYVTRNAWLDDEQADALRESVRYAFDAAEERVPDW